MSLARLGAALRLPFVAVGRAYNKTAQKNPFATGVVTTVLKTSAADLFAQKVVEGKEDMDWRRHGMFCMFGFAYLGCFQYYLYNVLFSKWCKPITKVFGHWGSAPVKTFIDQAIHHPLAYFPCFYLLKGVVEGRPVVDSLTKYREDLKENCLALWKIWVPAQLINFAIVPLHLRIPFVAAVSFAWTVVISVMRGALQHHHHDKGSDHSEPSTPSVASAAASAATAKLAPLMTVAGADSGDDSSLGYQSAPAVNKASL